MIDILIVDDEPKAREVLAAQLHAFVPGIGEVREAASAREALAQLRNFRPQLVFLDVVMPGQTGFDLLQHLGEWTFEVIFTTAHDQFAIQAIRFSALDYLLKPIDPDELEQAVERFREKQRETPRSLLENALHNLDPKQPRRLAIPTTDGVYFYDLSQIIRCEADSNYTRFFLADGKSFVTPKTLKEFDLLLRDQGFLRVHKSHLVNLDYVDDFLGKGFIRLRDKTEVEVARRRRDEVLDALRRKT